MAVMRRYIPLLPASIFSPRSGCKHSTIDTQPRHSRDRAIDGGRPVERAGISGEKDERANAKENLNTHTNALARDVDTEVHYRELQSA